MPNSVVQTQGMQSKNDILGRMHIRSKIQLTTSYEFNEWRKCSAEKFQFECEFNFADRISPTDFGRLNFVESYEVTQAAQQI